MNRGNCNTQRILSNVKKLNQKKKKAKNLTCALPVFGEKVALELSTNVTDDGQVAHSDNR